ncbi:MAG TPA: hypothetical protein VJG29_01010 [Candidatus Paceibacterota bacterium]
MAALKKGPDSSGLLYDSVPASPQKEEPNAEPEGGRIRRWWRARPLRQKIFFGASGLVGMAVAAVLFVATGAQDKLSELVLSSPKFDFRNLQGLRWSGKPRATASETERRKDPWALYVPPAPLSPEQSAALTWAKHKKVLIDRGYAKGHAENVMRYRFPDLAPEVEGECPAGDRKVSIRVSNDRKTWKAGFLCLRQPVEHTGWQVKGGSLYEEP